MSLFGPTSFRHNDLEVMNTSQLNARLEAVQQGHGGLYALYGDGIFQLDSCILRSHVGDNLTPRQIQENRAMKKVRISIEWNFGLTAKLYKYTTSWRDMKLRGNADVKDYNLVSTLLRNAHVCLYGCQTSNYFNCVPPTLEAFFV